MKKIITFPFTFLKESWLELRKVTWPTRKQALRLTFLVVAFSLAFSVFISGIDLLFKTGLTALTQKQPTVAPSETQTLPVDFPVTDQGGQQ